MSSKHPVVALVGRQNVGKSTLFNTLIGKRKAIVSPVRGTTRDWNMAEMSWQGGNWQLVDTGGIEQKADSGLAEAVRRQAERSIARADVVCFVVDGRDDLTSEDKRIAEILRASHKRIVLVINKIDHERLRRNVTPDIHQLGFGEVFFVSARNGTGTGDLLDRIASLLPHRQAAEEQETTSIVLLGKPNVGKSSLLNCLTNEERVIVSPEPLTTRDPQDTLLIFNKHQYRIIDTAGIRRAAPLRTRRQQEGNANIEQVSVHAGLRELDRADVAVVVLDCATPVTNQDRRILHIVLTSDAGALLVLNKWDLIDNKTTSSVRTFSEQLVRELPFLAGTPMVYASAKSGMRVFDILRSARKIADARQKTVPRDALENFLQERIVPRLPKRSGGGPAHHAPRLEQMGTKPPVFRLMIGARQSIAEGHKRFIIKELRSTFGFAGVPIHLIIEKRLRRT